MINIREIRTSDVDAMLALRFQWLSTQFNAVKTTELERDWFARYPGNSMAPALVAEEDSRLVGYVLCALMRHPAMPGLSALIDEVCVAESHRRQGIGRRLVAELRARLLSRVNDLSAIRTQVDREDETSMAFWTALGFEHHCLDYTDYLR
ncbi:MAG: GNAT family N-acetyltransferase [Chloroflexi bacterium]|nr:GNAT family N-acetyltransferase [Chloroflexota bacterium]